MAGNMKIFKERRQKLVDQIQAPILLVGAFEDARIKFHQESSFYYFTGVNEPGSFCCIDPDGTTTLFIPQYKVDRSQWVPGALTATDQTAQTYGFDRVAYLGQACKSYVISSYFSSNECEAILEVLRKFIEQDRKIFTTLNNHSIDRLGSMLPGFIGCLQEIMPTVAALRRIKDKHEIAAMYDAAQVTMIAHEAAARAIGKGTNECQVAASIDYVFTESNAAQAFPTIVGSGPNATVLHYTQNCRDMQEGECVVVDIGACVNRYCADITRTYPVSGVFTDRQKEVYQAVLDTHEHVAALAKPGYWLRNNDNPEKSLHHLALKFLAERGFDQYFVHGIGHFLGLDVHDVGDIQEPLQVGDVITIEPGVYISEESLGVRLEDDYWIVEDGAVCLTEDLPKNIQSIEKMVQETF